MERELHGRGSGPRRVRLTVLAALLLGTSGLARTGKPLDAKLAEADPVWLAQELDSYECPLGYTLLSCSNVLGSLGMATNPGTISNAYEVKVLKQWEGTASVGAVYGRDDEPLLMMNAILFPGEPARDRFLAFQRTLGCRTLAFVKTHDAGACLLLWAVDRNQAYTEDELRLLVESLTLHARQRGFMPLDVEPAFTAPTP